MKTTIEVSGFEIKIEEMDGKIMVSAMKDDEVVEEFELESEGMEGDEDFGDDEMEGDDDEMSSFGDDDMEEEEDFGDDEEMDGEDMDDEGEEMEEMEEDEEGKLESFNYFVKRRKK